MNQTVNTANTELFKAIGRLTAKEKMALYGYVCGLHGSKYTAAEDTRDESK